MTKVSGFQHVLQPCTVSHIDTVSLLIRWKYCLHSQEISAKTELCVTFLSAGERSALFCPDSFPSNKTLKTLREASEMTSYQWSDDIKSLRWTMKHNNTKWEIKEWGNTVMSVCVKDWKIKSYLLYRTCLSLLFSLSYPHCVCQTTATRCHLVPEHRYCNMSLDTDCQVKLM